MLQKKEKEIRYTLSIACATHWIVKQLLDSRMYVFAFFLSYQQVYILYRWAWS